MRALSSEKGASLIPPDTLKARYGVKGIVEEQWTECSVKGPSRRHMLVYLPSDYYSSGRSYPVLYLFHGARGNELSWITEGKVLNLIDSLTEASLAKEAILVLPNMNQYDDDADGGESRFKMPFESFFDVDGALETAFDHDVVQFVENHYRVIRDRKSRAIAGLSIGGFQAAYISADKPDRYGYVGLFSPFFVSYVTAGEYSHFYDFLEKKLPGQFADPPLYFIAIGKWDIYYNHIENTRRYFSAKAYPYEYYEGRGGHDWNSWPAFFCEFYKRIF